MSNIILRKDLASNALYEKIKNEAVALIEKPEHFDREMSWALQAINANAYSITQCRANPVSVLQSVLKICQCGLSLNPAMGHAYLVPYGGKFPLITMEIGYKGYISLITKKGAIHDVQADVIYDCDHFHETKGSTPKLVHEPVFNRPDDAKKVGAYAMAYLKNGHTHHLLMRLEDIHKRRDKSPSYKAWKAGKTKSCIWNDWEDEMYKKTPVRALSNFLQQEQPALVTMQLSSALNVDKDNYIADKDSGHVAEILKLTPGSSLSEEEQIHIENTAIDGGYTIAEAEEVIKRLKEARGPYNDSPTTQTGVAKSGKEHPKMQDEHNQDEQNELFQENKE